MSLKRPWSTYEAELQTCVAFGTPLPNVDDDASRFVPVWKQEVKDERGRKRLHGAFTGGWSAGYYNTVGSRDGWSPSSFISSRSNKAGSGAHTHRPEDYMDEEDLADAAEAQKFHTSDSFSGLGTTTRGEGAHGFLSTLFRQTNETLGFELLRKMGWKHGQGIGPKIFRRAILEDSFGSGTGNAGESHMFAPDDVTVTLFGQYAGRKGLGFDRKHDVSQRSPVTTKLNGVSRSRLIAGKPTKYQGAKSKIGSALGYSNDAELDDETHDDHLELGPRITFVRRRNGGRSTNKRGDQSDHTQRSLSRSSHENTSEVLIRGFTFSRGTDRKSSIPDQVYPPPIIPRGWVSAKKVSVTSTGGIWTGNPQAQVTIKYNPNSRATALGEQSLPGKSVFDFLSSSARERVSVATGRNDLPPAMEERLIAGSLSIASIMDESPWNKPKLDKSIAVSALARSFDSDGPYAHDQPKRERYETYLKFHAGLDNMPPMTPTEAGSHDALKEANEFHNCASIFRPMTGPMASRFITATSTPGQTSTSVPQQLSGVQSPRSGKDIDSSETAARLGMYGPLTRSVEVFRPAVLLCKRFGVGAPVLLPKTSRVTESDDLPTSATPLPGKNDKDQLQQSGVHANIKPAHLHGKMLLAGQPEMESDSTVVSGNKHSREDMLRQIFGESDSDG